MRILRRILRRDASATLTSPASRDICQAAVGAGVALELNNIIAKGDVIIVNCGMAYHGTSCGS